MFAIGGAIRSVLGVMLLVVVGCAPSVPVVDAAPVPVASPEVAKDPDAVFVEVDAQASPDDVAALESALRGSKRLTLAASLAGDRRLRLRFVTTAPRELGGHLEVEMAATGFTGETCQIFRLAPKLKKPSGRAAARADVEELRVAGVANIVASLEALAPKIGPNATCLSTGD
jgi:hypothetical protein